MAHRNLDLPDPVDALLTLSKEEGQSITHVLGASVYWFFHRLEAAQRELAKREYAEWIGSGEVPSGNFATEMEAALRNARQRRLKPEAPRKKGGQ